MTETLENQNATADTPVSNNVAPVKLDELEPINIGDRIAHIDLDDISPDDTNNIRRFPPTQKEIEKLAQDIAQNGQNTPMLVRKFKHEGKKFRVIEGFQRLKALNFINSNKLTDEPVTAAAIILDVDDAQALNTAISTMKRFPQSPIDIGHTIQMMEKEFGWTRREISKRLDRLPSQITEMVQFMELRPGIQRRIANGSLPYGVARTLNGLDDEEQDEAIASYDKTGDRDSSKAVRRKSKNKTKAGKEMSAELSLKEVKAMVNSLAGAIDYAEDEECPYPSKVQDVFKLVKKAMSGKLSEKALANKIANL